MLTVMTELFIKGSSWFAAEILHCWRQYALGMSACQGQWCSRTSSSAATSQAFKIRAPPSFVVSFVWGFRPVHPSVSLRQSPALQHHAGKLLVFSSPCAQHHLLHPVYCLPCCVSGSPPPHPGASGSQQFRAHPFPRSLQCSLRGFPSGFRDSRDLSSPALGLCSSLIWLSHDRAAALSGPALSVRLGVPRVGTGAPTFGLAALQKLGSE